MKKFLINVLTFLIIMASTAGLVYLKKTDDYKKEAQKQAEQNQIEVVEQDHGAELFFAAVSDVLARGVDLRVRVNVGSIPVTADVKMTIEPFAVHADIVAFGQGFTLDYAGDEVYVSANEMKFVADVEDTASAVELLTSAFALSLPTFENPLSGVDFSEVATKVTAPDLKVPYTDLGGGKTELALKLSDIGLDLSSLGLSTDFTAYLTVGGETGEEKFLSARLDKFAIKGMPEISVSATFGVDEFVLPQVDKASYADMDAMLHQIATLASDGVQANFAVTASDISVTGALGYDAQSGRAKLSAVYGKHLLSAVYAGSDVFVDYGNMKFVVSPEQAVDFVAGLGVQLPALPNIDFAKIDVADVALKLLASQFDVDGNWHVVKTTIDGYTANVWFGADGIEKIVVESEQFTLTLDEITECDGIELPQGEYYDVLALAEQGVDAYRYGAAFDVAVSYGDLSLSAEGKFCLDGADVAVSAAVTAMEQTVDVIFDGEAVYLQTRGASAFKAQISLKEIASFLPEGSMQLPEIATTLKTALGMLPTIAMIAGENQAFTLSLADVYGFDVSVVLSENGLAKITLTDGKDLSVAVEIGEVGTEQSPVSPLQPVDKDEYLPVSELAEQVFGILEDGIAFTADVTYDGVQVTAKVTVADGAVYVAVGNMKFTVGMDWVIGTLKNLPLPEIDLKDIIGAVLGGAFGSATNGYSYAFDILGAGVSLAFDGGALSGVTVALDGANVTVKDIVAGESVQVPAGDYYDVANLIDQIPELTDGVTLGVTATVDGKTYNGITVTWYENGLYISLGADELKFRVAVSEIAEIVSAMESAFNVELQMPEMNVDVAELVNKVLGATFVKSANNFVLTVADIFGVTASVTLNTDGIANVNVIYDNYGADLTVGTVVVPSVTEYIAVKELALQVEDIFDHGVSFVVDATYDGIQVTAEITVVNNTVYVAIGEMKFSLAIREILDLVGGTELPALVITEILDTVLDGVFSNNTYTLTVGDVTASVGFTNSKLSGASIVVNGASVTVKEIVAGESVQVPAGDYYDLANLIDQIPELMDGVTLGVTATVDGTVYQGITVTWYDNGLYISLGADELKFRVAVSEIDEILTAMQSAFNVEMQMPAMDVDVAELVNKVLGATFVKSANNFVLTIADIFGVTASVSFDENGIAKIAATYGEYAASLTVGTVVVPSVDEYIAVKELAMQVADIFDHGVSFVVDATYDGIQVTAEITVVNNTVYVAVGEMKFSLAIREILDLVGGTELPALVITEILDTVLDGAFVDGTYTLTLGDITASVGFTDSKLSGVTVALDGASVTVKEIVAGENVQVPAGDYYDVANLIDQIPELTDGVTLGVTVTVDGTVYQGITVTWYDNGLYISLGADELKFRVAVSEIAEIVSAMESAFNVEMQMPAMDVDVAELVNKVLGATFVKSANTFVLTVADIFGVTASVSLDENGIASVNVVYDNYSASLTVGTAVVPTADEYIAVKELATQLEDIFDHGVSFVVDATYDGIQVTAEITVVNNTVYVAVGEMKFSLAIREILDLVGGTELPALVITEILDTVLDGAFVDGTYTLTLGDITASVSLTNSKLSGVTVALDGASVTVKDIVAGESVQVPAGDYYDVANLIDQIPELTDGVTLGVTATVDGKTYNGITVTWYENGLYISLGADELKFKVAVSEIDEILTAMQSAFHVEMQMPAMNVDVAELVNKVLSATFNKVDGNFVFTVADIFGVTASVSFDENGIAKITATYGEYGADLTVGTVVVPSVDEYIAVKELATQVADIFDHGVSFVVDATYDGIQVTAEITVVNNTVYVAVGEMKFSLAIREILDLVGGTELPALVITEILDAVLDGAFANNTYTLRVGDLTASVGFTDSKLSGVAVALDGASVTVKEIVAGESVTVPAGDYYDVANLIDQIPELTDGVTLGVTATVDGKAYNGITVTWYENGLYISLGADELKFKVALSEIDEILTAMQSAFNFEMQMPEMNVDVAELVNKVLSATFNKLDGNFVLTIADIFGVNASVSFGENGIAKITATYGEYGVELTVGTVVVPSVDEYISLKELALQVEDIFDHGVSFVVDATYDGIQVTVEITVVNNTVYVAVGEMKVSLAIREILDLAGGTELPALVITEIIDTVLDGAFVDGTYTLTLGDVTASVSLTNSKLSGIALTVNGASVTIKDIVAGESVQVPAGDYYDLANLIGQVFDILDSGVEFTVNGTYQETSISATVQFRLIDGKPTASATITGFERNISVFFDGETVYVALGEDGLKAKVSVGEIPSLLKDFGIETGEEKLDTAELVNKLLSATFNKVDGNFVLTVADIFGLTASITFDESGVATIGANGEDFNVGLAVTTVGNEEGPITVGGVADEGAFLSASGFAQTAAGILDSGVIANIHATYQGRIFTGMVVYDVRGAIRLDATYGEHTLTAVYDGGTVYLTINQIKFTLTLEKAKELLEKFGVKLSSEEEKFNIQDIIQKVMDATFREADGAFTWTIALGGVTATLTLDNDGNVEVFATAEGFSVNVTGVTTGATVDTPTGDYYDVGILADQLLNAYDFGAETSFDIRAFGYALSGGISFRYVGGEIGAVVQIDRIARIDEDGNVAYTHAQPITLTLVSDTIYVAVGENGLKAKLALSDITSLIPAATGASDDKLEETILQVLSSAFVKNANGTFALTLQDLFGIDLTLTMGESGVESIGAVYDEINGSITSFVVADEDNAVALPMIDNASDYVDGKNLIDQIMNILDGGLTANVSATIAGNLMQGSVQLSLENGIAVRAALTVTRDGKVAEIIVHYVDGKIYVSLPSTGLKLVAEQGDIATLVDDIGVIASFFAMSLNINAETPTTTTDELIDGLMNGLQVTEENEYVLTVDLLGFAVAITFDDSGIVKVSLESEDIGATLSSVSATSGNFDGTVEGEGEYTSLSAITALTGGIIETMNRKAFAISNSVVTLPDMTIQIEYLNIQLAEEAGKNFFKTLGDRLMEIDASVKVQMGAKTHTIKLWYEYVSGATAGNGKTLFIEFDTLKIKMADDSMFGIIASVCQLLGKPLPDFLLDFLEDPENSDIFNQGGIGGDDGEDKPLDIDIPGLLDIFVSLSFENNGTLYVTLNGASEKLASLGLKDDLTVNVIMVTDAEGKTTLGGITASDGAASTFNANLSLAVKDTVALDVLTTDEAKAYVDISPIKGLLDSFLGTANKPDRATPSSTVKTATGEVKTTKNFYIEGDLKMAMKIIVGSINVNIKLYADILLTTIRDGNGNFLRQEVEAYVRSENDRTYLLGYGVFKGTGEIYYDNSIKENVNGKQKSVLYLSRNQDEKTSSWGSAKNKQYRKRIDMSYLGNTENAIRTIGLFFGMTGSMQQAIIDGVANANYTMDLTKLFAPLQQFDGKEGRPSDVNGNTQFYGYQPATSSSAGGHEIAINTFALTGEDMLKDLSILFGISHDNATNTDYIGSLNMKYYIELLGSGVTCTITTPNGGFKHAIGGTCPSDKTSCEGFGVWFNDQNGKGQFTEAVQYVA